MTILLDYLFKIAWFGSILMVIYFAVVAFSNRQENKSNLGCGFLALYLLAGTIFILPVMLIFWTFGHDSGAQGSFQNKVDWIFGVGVILYYVGVYVAIKKEKTRK